MGSINYGVEKYTRRVEKAVFAERFISAANIELNGGSIAGTIASFPVIKNVKSVIAKLKASDSGPNTVKINSGQTITITAGSLFGSYTNATAFNADDIQVDDYNKFEFVIIFREVLTANELSAYENGSMWSYDNNCVLALPMLLRDHKPTEAFTLDRSGNGNNAQFGDGSTASTFPTKLIDEIGYSFDGTSEYIETGVSFDFENKDYTIFTFLQNTESINLDFEYGISSAKSLVPYSSLFIIPFRDDLVLGTFYYSC
jgi:hypothetical protein